RSLDQLRQRVEQGGARRLATAEAALKAGHQRLRRGTGAVLDRLDLGLERTAAALAGAPGRRLRAEEARLDALAAQVRALDPERVLARGYSITRAPDGSVVRDAARLAAGDRVTTRLAAGSLAAVVESVTPSPSGEEAAS
ncbi:MAG TPA: exodeoxyribonuclease VII large subunit, partial [Acidimicrobiia bacterium]|nr:exodeoxyribonuclease VII large subunit [Acidimicrobiia bacterium]